MDDLLQWMMNNAGLSSATAGSVVELLLWQLQW
jgi:hypothetical protein